MDRGLLLLLVLDPDVFERPSREFDVSNPVPVRPKCKICGFSDRLVQVHKDIKR